MHVAAGGRRFKWDLILADVALPIIGADFLRHFGLMVYLGEPSGRGMFATIGVVADQPSSGSKGCAGKSCRQGRLVLLLHFPQWRHPLQLHFPQWRHPAAALLFSMCWRTSQRAQQVKGAAQAFTPRAALPGHGGPPSQCQVPAVRQRETGGSYSTFSPPTFGGFFCHLFFTSLTFSPILNVFNFWQELENLLTLYILLTMRKWSAEIFYS